jgi:beta-lactamase class A
MPMPRRRLLIVLVLALSGVEGLGVSIARGSAQGDKTALTLALEAELDRFPARTSIYVKHLKTGEEAAIRADESFNSQSVIKVPIMVRAFQLAEEGTLQLGERVKLSRADLRDGTGVFQYADLGLSPTVRDLILQMIITSDNTATDQMTTRVGGVEALNAWLARSGYKMRMLNRGHEYRRKLLARLDPRLAGITAEETTGLQYAMTDNPVFELYRPLFTGPRAAWLDIVRNPDHRRTHAANQRKLMVEDRNYWLGDISAREIGRMLEGIERETIASPASCSTMRTFMRRQLAGSRRLPHFIDVPVAHKTGDSGNIANDVGVIYARSGPIVVAVLVNGITGPYGEAEDRIGRIAKLVVDHFDVSR